MTGKFALIFILSTISFLVITSCKTKKFSENEKSTTVVIETQFGNIKAVLYNETPKHRDNFIKNVELGVYNGSIFHRVINSFMIQGGDPATAATYNNDSTSLKQFDYSIDAEFIPNFFHKKGALAAARMPDNVNPEKQSSSTQFYIVQGKVFTLDELETLAVSKTENAKNTAINNLVLQKANALIDEGKNPNFNEIYAQLSDTIEHIKQHFSSYSFSEEQKNIYTTVGGTPHLDGDYTVFGEVIEGFDVIDKIASVKTNAADKPNEDVEMNIKIIK